MDIEKYIENKVHDYYWNNDFNCARTTIKILAEIYGYKIDDQLDSACIGMHGAGGYRAQCGIVEGSLLFFGAYFKSRKIDESKIIIACHDFAESFEKQFGSLSCMSLRPMGFRKGNPPHACEELTKKGIEFTYDFIENISLKARTG